MAIIPFNEESQVEIEKRREQDKMVEIQGGFKFEAQTIIITILVLLLLFFLFVYPTNKAIKLPGGYETMPTGVIIALTLGLIVLMINKTVVNFMEYERGVVFRWGRFDRIAGPGWEIVFPLLERYVKVDLRLEVISPGVHEVVTKDKVKFLVAPEIFLYVSNPKEAVLNVQNYKKTVIMYVNSALTHTCGDVTSDYIVAHMNEISDMLGHAVTHMAEAPGKEWGVVIPMVKLAFIRFPDDVQAAMHKKVASEQLKLAAHEKAEAIKVEIDAIREAGGKLTDPALTYMYLESLDKVAKGKATKIVLPLEVTKIAETMSRRTAAVTGLGGGSGGDVSVPQDVIQKYTQIIDKYEKRLSQIENKLDDEKKPAAIEDKTAAHADTEKKKAVEDSNARIREEYRAKETGKPAAEKSKEEKDKEMDEYKEKIKEIKKRVGLSD